MRRSDLFAFAFGVSVALVLTATAHEADECECAPPCEAPDAEAVDAALEAIQAVDAIEEELAAQQLVASGEDGA